MKAQTSRILFDVNDKLSGLRRLLDDYMYRSGGIPEKDLRYCRQVYDSICKTQDLL